MLPVSNTPLYTSYVRAVTLLHTPGLSGADEQHAAHSSPSAFANNHVALLQLFGVEPASAPAAAPLHCTSSYRVEAGIPRLHPLIYQPPCHGLTVDSTSPTSCCLHSIQCHLSTTMT
ncbi:hypothetical protein HaLaN_08767 [Haematococcus lacustris]|uniref:Uncharacterized protein n=1 Tax=Haematococcus lacustris TaxID=44745 RepID=A0A699YUQ6_HAELA|nr:hypothetical protein HaLaN_08767 [Haematococcus lacustris]